MFMPLVWAIVVVVGIVMVRALWEGSWERFKWLGLGTVLSLLSAFFGWLEGRVAHLPWGLGTVASFLCGVLMLVIGIFGFVILIRMIFGGLEALKEESRGR
jgi:hypothetical protein